MIDALSLLLLPPLFYAETHYRFRFLPSYLWKREPELIADAPHRVKPGSSIPLLVLTKDAHRFPVTIQQIHLKMQQNGVELSSGPLLNEPVYVNARLWWKVYELPVPEITGWIDIDVTFVLSRHRREHARSRSSLFAAGRAGRRVYRNDNHRSSSRRPLRVFVAREDLPTFPGLALGDAHTHSQFTDDQVEFGAPLEASRLLSEAMGLSFFCVADHSYDLDDRLDDYLTNDSSLPKWLALHEEITTLNADGHLFAIIRGEEVTCRNREGRNVHLLLFGDPTFFPGSGDGAERWFRTRSELTVEEVLQKTSPQAVAVAAHPKENIPALQRLLLGRGDWSDLDLHSHGLRGLQFINGGIDPGFHRGYEAWVKALLKGRRLIGIAGNDAHGNFNRFRQVGIPFLKIRESDRQLFGLMRTGVVLSGGITETKVLFALQKGRVLMSDGPVVNLAMTNASGARASMGDEIKGHTVELSLDAYSTSEFGELEAIKVLLGEIGTNEEKTAFEYRDRLGYSFTHTLQLRPLRASYVRVEAFTSSRNERDGRRHFCFTNPIWIYP